MQDTESLYDQFVLCSYAKAPLTLVRGEGRRVWDDRGRCFLDFSSGIAVTAVGHAHPEWTRRVAAQAATLAHVSNLFRNPAQGQLAGRIVAKAGPGRVFFCNSGTEANEALIKLSRLHGCKVSGQEGVRHGVIVADHAFHGRTFGGMSATPQEKIQAGFRPLVPGFKVARFNDLESFRSQVDDTTSAILIENIQGEGGIHGCTPEFLQGLRRLCDEHDLLLLIDEVQCGIGRTGTLFSFEAAGITPDAFSLAKGLGGGFPIGAMWVAAKHAALFKPGSHGSTFGGNPLACAAALATLDIIESEGLLAHVQATGGAWLEQLRGIAREFPSVLVDARGRGLLLGVELHARLQPADLVGALRDRGLLAVAAGGNCVRLIPALNVTAAEIAEATKILRDALASLATKA